MTGQTMKRITRCRIAAGTNAVAWAMMVAGNAAVLRCRKRSKK